MDQPRDFYELCRGGARISGRPARLAGPDGLDGRCPASGEGTQPLRLAANVGDHFPAICTATGQANLSTLNMAVAEDRLCIRRPVLVD